MSYERNFEIVHSEPERCIHCYRMQTIVFWYQSSKIEMTEDEVHCQLIDTSYYVVFKKFLASIDSKFIYVSSKLIWIRLGKWEFMCGCISLCMSWWLTKRHKYIINLVVQDIGKSCLGILGAMPDCHVMIGNSRCSSMEFRDFGQYCMEV